MDGIMTGTLLPAGRIDWFVADESRRPIAQAVIADWRMGRVRAELRSGGLAAALDKYQHQHSAPLIIIELSDNDAAVDHALDQLADHCTADTKAIVIGAVNDVGLYRRLMARGVSDYLVAPVDHDDMLGAIARALGAVLQSQQGVMIGVTGAKGGVGATTIAQLFGLMQAERGHDSLLVDTLGGMGTTGIAFGVEAKRSFEEIQAAAVQGEPLSDVMRRVAVPITDHLRLLPGGRGQGPDFIESGQYLEWLDQVRNQTGVLVLDLPGAHHPLTRQIIGHLDHLVMVTTPMLSAMRLARLGIDQIQARRGADAPLHVVVNMVGCFQGHEVPTQAIKQAFEKETAYHMPFMPGLCAAADTDGNGFASGKLRDRAFSVLEPIAQAIQGGKTQSNPKQTPFNMAAWLAPAYGLLARTHKG